MKVDDDRIRIGSFTFTICLGMLIACISTKLSPSLPKSKMSERYTLSADNLAFGGVMYEVEFYEMTSQMLWPCPYMTEKLWEIVRPANGMLPLSDYKCTPFGNSQVKINCTNRDSSSSSSSSSDSSRFVVVALTGLGTMPVVVTITNVSGGRLWHDADKWKYHSDGPEASFTKDPTANSYSFTHTASSSGSNGLALQYGADLLYRETERGTVVVIVAEISDELGFSLRLSVANAAGMNYETCIAPQQSPPPLARKVEALQLLRRLAEIAGTTNPSKEEISGLSNRMRRVILELHES